MFIRDHIFPQAAEFRAEPQNVLVSAEFLCFGGLLQNLVLPVLSDSLGHLSDDEISDSLLFT